MLVMVMTLVMTMPLHLSLTEFSARLHGSLIPRFPDEETGSEA